MLRFLPEMHPDGAEMIVWQDGGCRCELWSIGGVGYLRVYAGADIIREEPVRGDRPLDQADQLRVLVARDDSCLPPTP